MSRVREVPIHLTRLEARELGRALLSADRILADALAAGREAANRQRPTWAETDGLELRRMRLATILDKLERAIGVPLTELGL